MASLFGRIFRIISFCMALLLVMLPVQQVLAAPFAAHVMDARTGETLYAKNAETRLHPASLTKMLTLYIAFEEIAAGRLSLDDKVTVTKHAAGQPPSRLGLKPGQKISMRYLIRAAAVKSANDAASAIGDHIGGNEAAFAKRMNRTAKALGMKNSTFRNANGLTAEGHLSTAHDMSILGRRLFYDFPQFYNIFSRRSADAGMATVNNTNRRFLDAYKGADGIKTGYTSAAGFNLTASAERDGKRIIATVFGGTSTANRNAKIMELLDVGFGEAPRNAPEQKPAAPDYGNGVEMALAEAEIDQVDAPGGAGKTVSVSGQVLTSLRPKSRPTAAAADVPQEVDLAMAASIEGALAEATAEPAPDGTLQAQAEDLAVLESTDETVEAADIDTDAAVALALAEAPPEGTLEAQALALADGSATAPAEENTLDAQANVLSEAFAAVVPDVRPKARPETLQPEIQQAEAEAEAPVTENVQVAEVVAEQPVVTETVAMADADQPTEQPIETASDMTPVDLADVTAVETVAGATNAAPMTLAQIAPVKRKAPIYDTVAVEPKVEEPQEAEVVVRVSTSGGRHFGVNVGKFGSRGEAEKALFKLALAESATLNQGLRKVTERDGAYRANFMGLTEEQAELACRRLRARAVDCETVGS